MPGLAAVGSAACRNFRQGGGSEQFAGSSCADGSARQGETAIRGNVHGACCRTEIHNLGFYELGQNDRCMMPMDGLPAGEAGAESAQTK